MNDQELDRSPPPLRAVLARALPLALIGAIVCAALAAGLSSLQENAYRATALVLVRSPVSDTVIGEEGGDEEGEGIATDALLVDRRGLIERITRRSDIPFEPEDLEEAVSAEQRGDTNVIGVDATTTDPQLSARVANAVAEEFVTSRREGTVRRARAAREALERQLRALSPASREGQPGVQLRERIQQLRVLESLGELAPLVVEDAEAPLEAESPRPRRNAILGGLFGLLVGGGLGLLWAGAERRTRDPQRVGEILGAPVLATVPAASRWASREQERRSAWRLVHLSLRHLGRTGESPPVRSVAVTRVDRPARREDDAPWELASAAATARERVLLVGGEDRAEADGSGTDDDRAGLEHVLAGELTLSESVRRVPVGDDGTGETHLELLVAGDERSPGLLASSGMTELLGEAAARYDLIVIDAARLAEHPEVISLLAQADGVVVAAPADADPRETRAVRERLDALRARRLGVVVTGA